MEDNFVGFYDQIRELVSEGQDQIALMRLIDLISASDKNVRLDTILDNCRITLGGVRFRERQVASGDLTGAEALREQRRTLASIGQMLTEFELLTKFARQKPVNSPVLRIDTWEPSEEKVWGESHLRDISWVRKGLTLSNAVCRIHTDAGFGSGFFVAQGYIITNHHVVTPEQFGSVLCEFNFESDSPINNGKSTLCKPLVDSYICSAELDIAAFRLVDLDLNLLAIEPLKLSTKGSPKRGDNVSIIQHPDGGFKKMAITSNTVLGVYDGRLRYQTHTLPGSSGSPVFSNSWEVVAIHRAGGALPSESGSGKVFANEGTLVASMLENQKLEPLFCQSNK